MPNHRIEPLYLAAAVTGYTFVVFASAFSWIAFMPQLPTFQVTSVTVTSLTTNTRSQLTAMFNVEGVLNNPNYVISIWYKSLNISLWFNHHIISSYPVEPLPFSTGPETLTPVRARFPVLNANLPTGVAKEIAAQRRFDGWVEFFITLEALYRFKFGAVGTNVRVLTLFCYPLQIAFPLSDDVKNNDTGRLVTTSNCYAV
ncbi:hypothetical protein VNO78_21123 [Psophocarpus tetragonolobus]|uniref:Late embryogenesis abundant protein LEA-2 subgroup domain-containing protein n=1 Tax=Psophocarpus tetragonolobus TaxID=3891 RepID=A0AAN9XHT5_PSOTE